MNKLDKAKINCPIVCQSTFCIFKDAEFDKNGETCLYMQKTGHYKTAKGEVVQRFLCKECYTTFGKYTNDRGNAYMRNRDLPIAEIVNDYENPLHTQASLAKKYGVSISTIRTILKNYKH